MEVILDILKIVLIVVIALIPAWIIENTYL
jgi:hypothetical protein